MKITVINARRLFNYANILLKLIALFTATAFLFGSIALIYPKSKAYDAAINNITDKSIVIIDAGHGGEDCGAIGINGVFEKDLNLKISNKLGDILTELGITVVKTRTEDKLLYSDEENVYGIRKISDLKNRCKIGAEYPKSIFVSIHMNSFGDSKYSGLQVYYSPGNSESEILANQVQSTVKELLQNSNNRKIKKGNGLYLLENLKNTAVLIECGFLTNETECGLLSNEEYQEKLCYAIAKGLHEYIKILNL